MAQAGPPRFFVCAAAALADGQHRKLKLLFEGRAVESYEENGEVGIADFRVTAVEVEPA